MRKFDSKKKALARQEFLDSLTHVGLTTVELKRLASDLHYSLSMIYDLIVRDHNDIVTRFRFSKRSIVNLFHKLGIVHNNKLYLRLPQEVKLQFKYPKGTSLEEIKKICSQQSSKGAKTTHRIRKAWDAYTPKNNTEYYLNKGYSLDEANVKSSAFRKSKSPFSRSFSNYQQLAADDVLELIRELSRNRGLKGLVSMRARNSKLELRVVSELLNKDIHCETQKILGKFAYDVFVPRFNLIIEVNGTYWHADPRVYNADDLIQFPYGQVKASEKWSKDEIKLAYARSIGYNVCVLWEADLKKEGYLDEFIKSINDSYADDN